MDYFVCFIADNKIYVITVNILGNLLDNILFWYLLQRTFNFMFLS